MSDKTKKVTVGELKQWIKDEKLGWTVNEKLNDGDEIPEFPLGVKEGAKLASDFPEADIEKILSDGTTSNVFLLKRLIDEKIIDPKELQISKVVNPQNSKIIDLDKLEDSES